jgi:hypothetical protein
MLSISTTLYVLHFEVTALKEGRHPERSVLGEVKDLHPANLRFFTAAKHALRDEGNAAVQNDEAFVIKSEALFLTGKHFYPARRDSSFAENASSE